MTKYEKYLLIIISTIFALGVFSFLDNVLAMGIIFCIFLAALTLLFIFKTGIDDKTMRALFIFAFLISITAVLFVYYFHFQPFSNSSGDYIDYHQNAKEIHRRLQAGNFSMQGLKNTSHYYAVVIGYIYTFTVPDTLLGQLFNAWLMALIAVVSYLIVIEIGGSKKGALLVGIITIFYPSLLFFGSLLLKDALIVFLSLAGVLLTIKLVKNFNYKLFILFYFISGLTLHFRFYIGFAILFTFIICWLLLASVKFKERLTYLLIIIIMFGFLPQFFVLGNAGYWGVNLFKTYVNQKTISYYREVAYAPQPGAVAPQPGAVATVPENTPVTPPSSNSVPVDTSASTFTNSTGFNNPVVFIKNLTVSFVYTILGPFPWQIKHARQLFALIEIIPWYVLLFFMMRGVIKNFNQYYKKNYKIFAPLIIFSIFVLGNIALFINNFGIITRIRIPAFICLLCFLPFGLSEDSIVYKYLDKIPAMYNRLKSRWIQR